MTSSVRATAQNTVTITYDLTLPDKTEISGTETCTTGQNTGAPRYYRRRADGRDRRGRLQYFHMWDPDAQLFDWLANEVFEYYEADPDAYFDGAAGATGTITVVDDQGPCHSCRSVIAQFKREFPKVAITVKYATGDTNRATRAAGVGKGIYGYDKGAVHDGLGWWTKTL
ncbi:deaminase domain-containing protein [Kutzneria kofuensis]|uniref:Uncharacterized protein n=1 Tax=Kutzneria kofuensis TaxID=103725 RepID=A0A7W9NER9_9PSEU|nr:deaminase domain-containing protein [Kutzneria kofuensis]MBB5889970.1 hypothetical protein [Kutzneria kofuensis]